MTRNGFGFGLLLTVATFTNAWAENIKIGLVGPRTGPAAASGKAFEEGSALAVEEINRNGGVLGKQIEVVFEDTAGVPEKAVAAMEKLVTKDKVALVVGESHSSSALAEIEIANRNQLPLIISEAWSDEITAKNYKWVFRAGPANSGVVNDYISKFVKSSGFKKAAIVAENTDWGKGISELTQKALTAEKIPFTVFSTERESRDHYTELSKIKAAKPDIILAYIYGFGLHYFLSQAGETGLTKTALVLDGAGPPSLWPEFWQNVGVAGEKELFVTSMHEKVHLAPPSKIFWSAYEKKYGRAPSDYKTRSTYDVVRLAANAIKAAGSTNNEAILKALESASFQASTGKVQFGLKAGDYRFHQWMPPMLVVQWQGKQQIVVYPPNASTGKLQKVN
jgi:branched-chain amino acid transport system substrate-binding protein